MKRLLIMMLSGCFVFNCAAQKSEAAAGGKNVIKVNLSAIAISHYAIQYERVTKRKQSFAIGFGISPNVSLPFKNSLMDQYDENDDARRAIDKTKFTKITITPEYRFYMGKKGAPRGFYIAPFLRYTHMSITQDYVFETTGDEQTPDPNDRHTSNLKGKFNGGGAGFLLGAQWLFGKKKNISLDWWIAGPFIGFLDAKFHGTGGMDDFDDADRAKLEKDIEDTDLPLWSIDATVGQDVVDAKLKGPFYGLRLFGICVGYRF